VELGDGMFQELLSTNAEMRTNNLLLISYASTMNLFLMQNTLYELQSLKSLGNFFYRICIYQIANDDSGA
jgi:hypothetical protein